MDKKTLFWLIYIIAFLFGGFWCYHDHAYWGFGWPLGIEWVLIGLLGWIVCGPAVK